MKDLQPYNVKVKVNRILDKTEGKTEEETSPTSLHTTSLHTTN